MPKLNVPLLAWNRGEVSPSALARVDVDRIRLSAETMINWVPKSQGPMKIRPGLEYIGSSINDTGAAWIDFIASTDDTALLEVTHRKLRARIDDVLITRPAVASIVNFATDTGLWQNKSTNGGTIAFGDSGGISGDTGLILNAVNYGGTAKATRKVALSDTGEINVEHALAITVARGPVTFRCGNDTGNETYIPETVLRTGRHSLSFTPTAAEFHLTFLSSQDVVRIVSSIAMDTGTLELVAPWDAVDLTTLRGSQSAVVVFVWADGYQQRRIERRGTGRSWSVVKYDTDDGPFTAGRTADDVRLRVWGTRGNLTMQSDKPFFGSDHVGSLFRLFHEGYNWSFNLGRDDTWTDPIRVTGLSTGNNNERNFSFVASGTWVATGNMHVSSEREAGYRVTALNPLSASTETFTGNATTNYAPSEGVTDNLIEYFRIGIEPGNYTSGTMNIKVIYQGNGDHGIVRIVSVTNSTTAVCEVLRSVSDSGYTDQWREGRWSTYRGFPNAGALYEGRLWHAGGSRIYGSVSDDYASFDEEVDGDAGPINRTFGEGPVDTVNFLLPLEARLVAGTSGSEIGVRSSSFDEPLTPTNMNAKDISTQGSLGDLRAVRIDTRGVFVQRSGQRVFELVYNGDVGNYTSRELTLLHPDLAKSNPIVDIAVQRQPDTRIHFVLQDGTAVILTYEPEEELVCWSRVETDTGTASTIEKVVVLPGANEDAVYYHVRRTINGSTKRYLERWAMETECEGGKVCRLADSFKTWTDTGTTIEGFSHLALQQVIVWGDSGPVMDTGTGEPKLHTISGGGVLTLSAVVRDGMAGLPYVADYKSTKLAYAAGLGTALTQRKRINQLGIIAKDMHNKALRVGRDFNTLMRLPDIKEGANVANTVHETYDIDANSFPGEWNTDSRLCVRAVAPLPVTLLAAIVGITSNDKG